MPIFIPVHPPRNPDECPAWLHEAVKRLNRQALGSTQGFAAILRGEAPDGSGAGLIDTGRFFVKPGLTGGQKAHGGLNATENLTLSSTASSAKGLIYLGSAQGSAYDEVNDRLGLGITSPTAALHLKRSAMGTAVIGAFGPSMIQVTVAASEIGSFRSVLNNGGIIDLAFVCPTVPGEGNQSAFVVTNATGTGGLRLVASAGAAPRGFIQAGVLNSSGVPINTSLTIGAINSRSLARLALVGDDQTFLNADTSGNTTYVSRVGLNVDPNDYRNSVNSLRPDTLLISRRTTATTGVSTVIIEGPSGTEKAFSICTPSSGGSPTKQTGTPFFSIEHSGVVNLHDAGGAGAIRSRLIVDSTRDLAVTDATTSKYQHFGVGTVTAWGDSKTVSRFMQLGDLNSTHRDYFFSSIGFGILTRLGFSSAYTLVSNGQAGGASGAFPAPEAAPTVLRLLNTSTAGSDTSIVLKVETLRSGQSGRLVSLVGSSGEVAGMTAAGNYFLLSGGASGKVYVSDSGGVGSWGAASSLATRVQFQWRANGPYQVDTGVDGKIRVPTGMTITSVRLYRVTAGSSGSTIVDLNKNGTTMYTTQANRPTVTAAGGNDQSSGGTLPDVVAVAAGDVLSADTDQIEDGTPSDYVLIIEGV